MSNEGITEFDISGKKISDVLGEAVWLMSQDKILRNRSIKSLEKDVMPSILKNNFKLFYVESTPSIGEVSDVNFSNARPVGFVTWTLVEQQLNSRSEEDKLSTDEINSKRTIMSVVPMIDLVVAPFGGADAMKQSVLREMEKFESN